MNEKWHRGVSQSNTIKKKKTQKKKEIKFQANSISRYTHDHTHLLCPATLYKSLTWVNTYSYSSGKMQFK